MPTRNPDACYSWPNCACHRDYLFWRAKCDEWMDDPSITKEDIIEMMPSMFVVLACMSSNCWDRNIARQATANLLHPMWADLRKELRWP
jgi:hypothetical protein